MSSIQDAAVAFFRRGWTPLPIKAGSKAPEGSAWQKTTYSSEEEVAGAFLEAANVGLLLGAPSGGLVDVDLDAPEARAVAPAILPDTAMVSGRAGSPRSHFWYVVPDPEGRQSFTHRGAGDTLVELRGTGGQTVVPPFSVRWRPRAPVSMPLEWDEVSPRLDPTIFTIKTAERRMAARSPWSSFFGHRQTLPRD